jgi:hypothetical protein
MACTWRQLGATRSRLHRRKTAGSTLRARAIALKVTPCIRATVCRYSPTVIIDVHAPSRSSIIKTRHLAHSCSAVVQARQKPPEPLSEFGLGAPLVDAGE